MADHGRNAHHVLVYIDPVYIEAVTLAQIHRVLAGTAAHVENPLRIRTLRPDERGNCVGFCRVILERPVYDVIQVRALREHA
jgi:hypothetical protein